MGNRARHNARGLVRVTIGEVGDFTSFGANIPVVGHRAQSEEFARGIQEAALEGFHVITSMSLAIAD